MSEHLEPETLRSLHPELSEEEFQYMMAVRTIKESNLPFENFYAFENVVTALNFVIPDFAVLEPPTAEQLWHGIKVMLSYVPERKFEWEVKIYAKGLFNEYGIYFYPREIDDSSNSTSALKRIQEKSEMGPFPLQDDNILDIQASHYLALDLYNKIESGKDLTWMEI